MLFTTTNMFIISPSDITSPSSIKENIKTISIPLEENEKDPETMSLLANQGLSSFIKLLENSLVEIPTEDGSPAKYDVDISKFYWAPTF